ncbi:MAG: hypothetical protein O8C64_15280 [Candidatus Methanoperedens sp.]|nr:hypothetical protein [Candidatus Methanoperedens sp.]MCZ7403793.1 hypothetical protein [Candidatus Methanoperedens sp.]
MKFRKDRDILKLLGFCLAAILAGTLIILFIPRITIIGVISISSGLMGFIIGFRIASKPKDYFMEDERSGRIKETAGYYAYEIMVSVAAVIMFLNIVKLSPSLTPSSDFLAGALLIWVIGLYSFLILKWYSNKKGDIK